MAKAKTLTSDPRWKEFRNRFAFNLAKFQVEVCGYKPTWQQFAFSDSISLSGSRTSVSSGHGTGKSRVAGSTAWWHLTCYANSNMLITAPKIEQVRNVVWKEIYDIKDYISRGKYAWILEYIEVEAERFYIKERKNSWYVIAKTAPRGSPENMAGMHRKWLLIWVDEASGVPETVYPTLMGALTDKRNRMVMSSQPTRDNGFFYDSHDKKSLSQGGEWNNIVLNSEESPLVSIEWLIARMQEYGGRDSPEYQVRILGQFADKSDEYLLGKSAIRKAIGRKVIEKTDLYGIVITVDVAAGEFRDKSCVTVAHVTGDGDSNSENPRKAEIISIPLYSNNKDVAFLTAFVFNLAQRYANPTVVVDSGGLGITVCQKLEEHGLYVIRVNWGKPCIKLGLKERFRDRRGYCTYSLARAIKDGRFGIGEQAAVYEKEIVAQGGKLPYGYDDKFRLYIESKQMMREHSIASPDIFDTFCFLFLEEVVYTVSDLSIDERDGEDNIAAAKDDIKGYLKRMRQTSEDDD